MEKRKKGIVIGRFDPPHQGHLALIEYALTVCRKVVVLICTPGLKARFPTDIRLRWMKRLATEWKNVRVEFLDMPMPDLTKSSRKGLRHWAETLGETYPSADAILTSEEFGDELAEAMSRPGNEVVHIPFDPERKLFPVSSTLIVKDPFRYWDFIPLMLRPYFIRRVCLVGPEGSGKTTLAHRLAKRFHTVHVKEQARRLIDKLNLSPEALKPEHLLLFASAQRDAVETMTLQANKLLFCDSGNLSTRLRARELFRANQGEDPGIVSLNDSIAAFEIKPHFYLLLKPDHVAKEPKRNPSARDRNLSYWAIRWELVRNRRPYAVISGADWNARFRKAIVAVQKHCLAVKPEKKPKT